MFGPARIIPRYNSWVTGYDSYVRRTKLRSMYIVASYDLCILSRYHALLHFDLRTAVPHVSNVICTRDSRAEANRRVCRRPGCTTNSTAGPTCTWPDTFSHLPSSFPFPALHSTVSPFIRDISSYVYLDLTDELLPSEPYMLHDRGVDDLRSVNAQSCLFIRATQLHERGANDLHSVNAQSCLLPTTVSSSPRMQALSTKQ